MGLLRRRRWDPPRTSQATILLASSGEPFSPAAITRAAELASSGTVAVISIARLHGYAFGLPNPGLLPTKQEKDRQFAQVKAAISTLEKRGRVADGQVAVSRAPAKVFARAAKARGVSTVVIDRQTGGRARRLVEGDIAIGIRRRLRGSEIDVDVVG
jgi:hypothetical protein